MTAEIAILNREAIALAADSAVTIGDTSKIFAANKIFALSKWNPVGVMMYANATFMGAPWETLIKEYRSKLGDTGFATLAEYATHFLAFVAKHPVLTSPEAQEKQLRHRAYAVYRHLCVLARNDIKKRMHATNAVSENDARDILKEHLDDLVEDFTEMTDTSTATLRAVEQKYKKDLQAVAATVGGFTLTRTMKKDLLRLGALAQFVRHQDIAGTESSGLVVAGFGEGEIFPSIEHYMLHGIVADNLLYDVLQQHRITTKMTAAVHAFAQADAAGSFMNGVDQRYQESIEDDMWNLLDGYTDIVLEQIPELTKARKDALRTALAAERGKAFDSYTQGLQAHRRDNYANRVLQIVDHLPKHELAQMAESLVSLQSLRRRISMDLETVGGPVDVAIISKGDGLIWVKRKHYFDSALNPGFVASYLRR